MYFNKNESFYESTERYLKAGITASYYYTFHKYFDSTYADLQRRYNEFRNREGNTGDDNTGDDNTSTTQEYTETVQLMKR
mmetsp:Transcript_19855/g.18027  ORF Transcript_19855/g.18027 Transcript_19855/m.18027 type:complete len:80 (+) Transcript_19855:120-359(+)